MTTTTNLITRNNLTENTGQESLEEIVPFFSTTEVKVALALWKFVSPVIIVSGTFGNSVILITQRSRSPGGANQAMSVFFCALATSDLFLLFSMLLKWTFYTWAIDVTGLHDFLCKVQTFAAYLCTMVSPWCLVCMTLQRMVSVVWPHRIHLLCTKHKAKVTLVIVVIFFASLNAHILASIKLVETSNFTYCDYDPDDRSLEHFTFHVFPWLDLLFSSLIPSAILLIGNAVLAACVARAARQVVGLTSVRQLESGSACRQSRARQKAASSLTVLVMSVSLLSFLLTLPVCAFFIVQYWDDVLTAPETELFWAVSCMLWYSNSAINFYVYCLMGTKFRAQVKRLFVCRDERPGGTATSGRPQVFVLSSSGTQASGGVAHEKKRNTKG